MYALGDVAGNKLLTPGMVHYLYTHCEHNNLQNFKISQYHWEHEIVL